MGMFLELPRRELEEGRAGRQDGEGTQRDTELRKNKKPGRKKESPKGEVGRGRCMRVLA